MKCHCGREVEEARVRLLDSKICSNCAKRGTQHKVCGIMLWDHKTAPTIQLTSKKAYDNFKRDTNRKGQQSILRSKSPAQGRAL